MFYTLYINSNVRSLNLSWLTLVFNQLEHIEITLDKC